jgi:hypothetical protein
MLAGILISEVFIVICGLGVGGGVWVPLQLRSVFIDGCFRVAAAEISDRMQVMSKKE